MAWGFSSFSAGELSYSQRVKSYLGSTGIGIVLGVALSIASPRSVESAEREGTGLPAMGSLAGPSPVPAVEAKTPLVSSMLKAEVFRRVKDDRDVMTRAVLQGCEGECASLAPAWMRIAVDPDGGQLRWYGFYAAMLIRAPLSQTRAALTNYRLYPKLVPNVDRAEYDPKSRVLYLEGGIWKYRLSSSIRFDEIGEKWIRFEFVGGHFQGMKGELVLESAGEAGTLVAMRGETFGRRWPPALIVEQGAQIIFSLTGNKMRSFIESRKSAEEVLGLPPQGSQSGLAPSSTNTTPVSQSSKEGTSNARNNTPERESSEKSAIPQPRRRL